MGITANDIICWVERLKKGSLNHEEGLHHGRPDEEVEGITVCWKASPDGIAAAGERGDRLIVGHESLHYPYYFDFDPDRTPGWETWTVNTRRMERLDEHGLSYLRLHSSIDWLCIMTTMAIWLELTPPRDDRSGWDTIWEVEETTVGELIERVRRISGMNRLRVSMADNLTKPVRRIGLLVGGAALVPNGRAFEPGVRAGVDVFIAGETDDYGFRYATECGIPLIESSHEVSENAGFRHFAGMLAREFPSVRVTYYENSCPFVVL